MSLKHCARCGHGNESAADFCGMCGLRVGASGWGAVAPAHAPAPVAQAPSRVIPFDFPVRRLRAASDALAPTFRLYRTHYDTLGKVVLAAALPQTVLEYAVTRAAVSPWEPGVISMASGVATSSLMTGALVYTVMTLLRTGASPPVAESYRWGLRKWLRLGLCWVVLSVLTWGGLLLLLVPGIFLMTVFAVSLPAAAAEDLGPFASMGRSAELTRGYRWLIFETMLVTWAAILAAVWLTTGFSAPQFAVGSSLLVTLVYAAVSKVAWSALTVLSIFTYLGIRADRGEGLAPAPQP